MNNNLFPQHHYFEVGVNLPDELGLVGCMFREPRGEKSIIYGAAQNLGLVPFTLQFYHSSNNNYAPPLPNGSPGTPVQYTQFNVRVQGASVASIVVPAGGKTEFVIEDDWILYPFLVIRTTDGTGSGSTLGNYTSVGQGFVMLTGVYLEITEYNRTSGN